MKVIKNLILFLVMICLFFAGVGSMKITEFTTKQSKQRLFHEITQNLANKDVECLNYFAETTEDTFWFNIPVVYMSLQTKRPGMILKKCLRGCHKR